MRANHLYTIGIFFICTVSFFVYSAIYFSVRPSAMGNDMWIFNTPDETANYFFIDRLVRGEELAYPEPLNDASQGLNLVHPRSTTVVNNQIVPGSFLGFILVMETFGRVLGSGFIPFVVPLVSVGALLSFYLFLQRHFDRRVALVSMILLAMLPAYWYYNSRSLFNNILFIDLVIIGLYQLQRYLDVKRWQTLILSGLILGVALTIRTTDVLWVMMLIGGVVWSQRRLVSSWASISLLIFGILVAFIPILQMQASLYGSPFVTGYVPEGIGSMEQSLPAVLVFLQQFILPFGFHPLTILSVLYHYGLKMFWWLIIGGAVGIAMLLWRWWRGTLTPQYRAYTVLLFVISIFISMYYGSWSFSNNLSGQALIGSSQVRYLLPVYVMLIPAVALAMTVLADRFFKPWQQRMVIVVLVCIIGALSIWAVLFKGPENLLAVRRTIIGYHQLNVHIRTQTEDAAVIVTSYHDKVFFPSRKIIFYWDQPQYLQAITSIAKNVPVYLYSINPEADQRLIEDNSDLNLQYVSSLRPGEVLYKITP